MNDPARDPKQIGAILRRARKKQALSQQQLGAKAGLSLIETGNPAARIETLSTVLSVRDLTFQIAPRSKRWAQNLKNDF